MLSQMVLLKISFPKVPELLLLVKLMESIDSINRVIRKEINIVTGAPAGLEHNLFVGKKRKIK